MKKATSFRTSAALVLLVVVSMGVAHTAEEQSVKEQFQQAYREWKDHVETHKTREDVLSSRFNFALYYENEPWRKLTALGPRIAPYVLDLVERRKDTHIGHALPEIVKWRFHLDRTREASGKHVHTIREFPDITSVGRPVNKLMLWKMWLTEGYKQVPQRFHAAYARCKALDERLNKLPAGDPDRAQLVEECQAALREIADLGVHVLPHLVAQVEKGDRRLIPIIHELTNGDSLPPADSTIDEGQYIQEWWQREQAFWTVPPIKDGPGPNPK